MRAIKAIETRYAGCRFRSRTEARWAVFFDHCGVEWEYEKEGFDLSEVSIDHGVNLGRYLPDFYLPRLDTWVEIKGSLPQYHFNQTPEELAIELVVDATNAWAGMVIFGPPGAEVPTFVYGPSNWRDLDGDGGVYEGRRSVQPYAELEWLDRWIQNRRFTPNFTPAIEIARSARFEFGERGGR